MFAMNEIIYYLFLYYFILIKALLIKIQKTLPVIISTIKSSKHLFIIKIKRLNFTRKYIAWVMDSVGLVPKKNSDVKMGHRQGCILSRTLFNITLDYIIRQAIEGIQIGERSLKGTEYDDNAALLAETLMAAVALTNYLANESQKFGLKLNFPKAKIMTVIRKFGPPQQAEVNKNNIEVVEIFYILVVNYATRVGRRPT